MRRVLPAVFVLVLAGCGDSGGGGSLIIEPDGEVKLIATSNPLYLRNSIAVAATKDGVALVWGAAAGDDNFAVYGLRLDADLTATGARTILSGADAHSHFQATVCSDKDRLAVAWSEILPDELYVFGDNTDTGNTMATFSWEGGAAPIAPSRVNPNLIGRQIEPSIACLADGNRAVTWSNSCLGYRRIGSFPFETLVSFTPEECPSEPEEGAYLQIFDATGAPVGDMHRVRSSPYGKVPVAALVSGDVLVFAGSNIELRSGNGELVEQFDADGASFEDAAVSCSGRRCAAAVDGNVWIVDAKDLDSSFPVIVEEETHPTENQRIFAKAAGLACDENALCVVTWARISETWIEDYVLTEPQGVFARALDLRTGRMGPTALVIAPVPNGDGDGVHVVSTGSDRFLLAGVAGEDIRLQPVAVR